MTTVYFRRFRRCPDSMAIFGTKRDVDNQKTALEFTKSPLRSPKISRTFGPQTAKNMTSILPTLRKFCILCNCQPSHKGHWAELSQTLPHVGKWAGF